MRSKGEGAIAEEMQGAVPKLRFPGFEREAWETKPLSEVCLRITNGKANAEDHEEDGIYPLFDRSETVKKSQAYTFDGEVVILPGEGMRFQPRYYEGKFNLHQRAYALMQFQQNAKFVFHTLDYMKDEIARKAVKSTVLSLRLPIIKEFEIALPKAEEQDKIADCLSSL
ncbi:MAG: restriction endonuclease subunit S, partial [Gammaproteobacteria bacterium]|nr:restriction endonuclease subunit S [Gammaproteobacteria bacterium]